MSIKFFLHCLSLLSNHIYLRFHNDLREKKCQISTNVIAEAKVIINEIGIKMITSDSV